MQELCQTPMQHLAQKGTIRDRGATLRRGEGCTINESILGGGGGNRTPFLTNSL